MRMDNLINNNNCNKSHKNKVQEKHLLILKTLLHLILFIVHYKPKTLIASSK